MSRAPHVVSALAALVAAGAVVAWSPAQGQGLDAAPREARAFLARAVEAMGGAQRLAGLRAVAMVADHGKLTETHTLAFPQRYMHYASRRRSGAGFDVVLGERAFICDRDREGQATYVEDLSDDDANEGAYERDILFMPLLLPQLLADPGSRLEYRGENSAGDPIVRAAVRPPRGTPGKPFWIRLRFDKRSHHLVQSMGLVPCGANTGQKRYTSYLEPREAQGGLVLPTQYEDQRDEQEPRRFTVTWRFGVEGVSALFSKPDVD